MKSIKIIYLCIISVVVILLICLGISKYLELDMPVYFENFCEYETFYEENPDGTSYIQDLNFSIQYVTNVSDSRTVSTIHFPYAPEIYAQGSNYNQSFSFFSYDNNQISARTYGRYSVRDLYINVMFDQLFDDIILTKAIIYYNNGDMQEVELGKIVLRCHESQVNYIVSESSGGSNDGTAFNTYRITKDVELVDITSPFKYLIDEIFEITINNVDYKDISGTQLKEGSSLRIEIASKNALNESMIYNIYRLLPMINYQDMDGNKYSIPIYNVGYIPIYDADFTFSGLINYFNSKGAL
ncbi:MAG: hypothetical protein GX363_01045 [Clostridiales bacterium]|nr:hypothetical protein [Clostridiales bacterium]